MKKLFTLLLSIGSFTAVFAQSGHNDDRDNNRYDQRGHDVAMTDNGRDRGYQNGNVYNYPSPSNHGMDDKGRQQETDRVNRDYDSRIDGYRKDRSLSAYERDRHIAAAERERREKTGSFVKGAVIGGVAGVLLGVLISY